MEHDPESAMVELDKAVLQGHMAYPDILGRIVTVWFGKQKWVNAECVANGPLGFVLYWTESREVTVGDGTYRIAAVRQFIPWTGSTVEWVEWLHTDEQDPGGREDEQVADLGGDG